MFLDLFALSNRIKSEAEKIRKVISNVCSNFFQTEQIGHSSAALDQALALAGCPAGHTGK